MRFLDANLWLDLSTVVTASSEAPALPAVMAQNPERTAIWRSLRQSGEQFLRADLGSVQTFNALGLVGVKRLTGGSLVFEHLGSLAAPGSATTVIASVDLPDDETGVTFETFGSVTARHVQLRWTNPDSALDEAECGFVGLGEYFAPTLPQLRGWNSARVDPSVKVTSPDGQLTVTQRTPYARGGLTFHFPSTADVDRTRLLCRRVGVHTPLFMSLRSDLTWTHLFARLTDIRELVNLAPGAQQVTLLWEEAR